MIREYINLLNPDRELRGNSKQYANWMSVLEDNSCRPCVYNHGKIVDISTLRNQSEVEAHPNCQCRYVPMRTKVVGTATKMGYNGADFYRYAYKTLPEYYVDKNTATAAGWDKKKGNLHKVLPGKSIGGDIYTNENQKLPSAPDRIWYEADLNYEGGKRNRQRLLYSNDGLLFVTYDHYRTFYEITA